MGLAAIHVNILFACKWMGTCVSEGCGWGEAGPGWRKGIVVILAAVVV